MVCTLVRFGVEQWGNSWNMTLERIPRWKPRCCCFFSLEHWSGSVWTDRNPCQCLPEMPMTPELITLLNWSSHYILFEVNQLLSAQKYRHPYPVGGKYRNYISCVFCFLVVFFLPRPLILRYWWALNELSNSKQPGRPPKTTKVNYFRILKKMSHRSGI